MQWQYKVITLGADGRAITKALNELGAARWELVTVRDNEKTTQAFFKRPMTEADLIVRL